MKRLFALLLAVVLVIGLVACGGNTTTTDPSAGGNNGGTNNGGANNGGTNNGGTNNGGSTGGTAYEFKTTFQGTSLQIWGIGAADAYTDFENMGKGNYNWMMFAAIDEWAAMSGVTIEWKGSYNQGSVLADINSGAKPDLIFQSNQFPAIANLDMVAPFTEAEEAMLAELCGDARYLEMMTTKGAAYGFVYPWSGNWMLYYNKSMFERYDVKTPKEYYMEGNWTWTTLKELMEKMTRDLNGDGTTDTYGLPVDSVGQLYPGMISHDRETGMLSSRLEEQISREWLEFVYEGVTIKGTIKRPGAHNIQKNVAYPMYAMQISDCEPYNFEHLYQSIPNGDVLEVVPVPAYDGEAETITKLSWTQSAASLCTATDNRDAAVDLLCYLIQCGRKYIEDFSLGAVKCDFAGIQGYTENSKGWKDAFTEICELRAEDIQDWDYDEELVAKYYETFAAADIWTCSSNYTGVKFSYKEIYTMPPASSIPAIKDKWQAQLDTYNSLYT